MSPDPQDPAGPATGQPATTPPARGGGSACARCHDTGTMRWLQPTPVEGGGVVRRELTHPCTCQAARDAGLWRHPAAESGRVVGQAAAAQVTPPGLAALLDALMPPGPTRT